LRKKGSLFRGFQIQQCTDISTLSDGTYDIFVSATDSAGNTDNDATTDELVVDMTIPSTSYTTTPPSVTNNDSLYYEGTSTDGSSGIVNVEYWVINNDTSDVEIDWTAADPVDGNFDSGLSENFSFTTDPLADGEYTVESRATDAAGNIESTATHLVTVDTTEPYLVSQTTFSGWYTSDQTSTFTYADDGSGIVLGTPVTCDTTTEGTNQTCSVVPNVCDAAGNCNTTEAFSTGADIDKSLPDDPTPASSSHSVSTWANDDTVDITWSGAVDSISGVDGFYTEWNTSTAAILGSITKTYEETDNSETSLSLADGNSHYFHIATVDNAGNWTSTAHLGPFWIDTTLPTDPTDVDSTSHTTSVSNNDDTIDMAWTVAGAAPGATDATSGVDGYSYELTAGATDVPDDTKDLEETETGVTSGALADNSWYFHLRTVDNTGNWTSTVHAGPFIIDTTAPTGGWTTPTDGTDVNGTVSLEGTASDTNGVASVEFQYKRNDGIDTFHTISTDSSDPFAASWDTSALVLDNYTLRMVITDSAGNPTNLDITVGVSAVISDETSSSPKTNGVTITWTTNQLTSSRVVYDTLSHLTIGSAPNYGYAFSTATFDSSPKVTNHSVTITGLSNGTTYYYRTVSEGSPVAVGDEGSFKTKSKNDGDSNDNGGGNGTGTVSGISTTGPTTSTLAASTIFTPIPTQEAEVLGQEVKESTPSFESPNVQGVSTSNGILDFLTSPWGLLLIVLSAGLILYIIKKSKEE